ncbi:MAG: phage tail protein [Massilia sp.]
MYVGEIRMFAGNFPPNGWRFCDGSLLSIAENEVLFVLIGTTYGGDGESTFALPDFRGRVPIHNGNGHILGELGGTESVTLTTAQLPSHTHLLGASASAPAAAVAAIDITGPTAYVPGSSIKPRLYAPAGSPTPMAPGLIAAAGGSQPHNNMAPFLGLNFIISLFGVFPSQA